MRDGCGMKTIAFLTSSNMIPGAADERPDLFEYHHQFGVLEPACAARGLVLEPVVWDADGTDWGRFDAALVGTTWDYWDKRDAFVPALRAIEARLPLFNSADVVAWNIDKIYLRALADGGVACVPTVWADDARVDTLAAACAHFDCDGVVAKPRVSASADGLIRWRLGDAPPTAGAGLGAGPEGACLIQPFLPLLPERGEVSVMTYGGQWSHAVRKIPAAGDFRVQSLYGGEDVEHQPSDDELAVVAKTLSVLQRQFGGEALLYARIDIAPGLDGEPVVMEAELIEPYHYPVFAPECGDRFAAALERVMVREVMG